MPMEPLLTEENHRSRMIAADIFYTKLSPRLFDQGAWAEYRKALLEIPSVGNANYFEEVERYLGREFRPQSFLDQFKGLDEMLETAKRGIMRQLESSKSPRRNVRLGRRCVICARENSVCCWL